MWSYYFYSQEYWKTATKFPWLLSTSSLPSFWQHAQWSPQNGAVQSWVRVVKAILSFFSTSHLGVGSVLRFLYVFLKFMLLPTLLCSCSDFAERNVPLLAPPTSADPTGLQVCKPKRSQKCRKLNLSPLRRGGWRQLGAPAGQG